MSLYDDFLQGKLGFQKGVGLIGLDNIVVITGTTGAGKSTLISKLQLPCLISYKTSSEEVEIRPGQMYIAPDKFMKKMEKGDFFDIYKLDDKFYAYAIRDYFVVSKKYGTVYIEASLENIVRGLQYIPKHIVILSVPQDQLAINLEKRASERGYTVDKTQEASERQQYENTMIPTIIQKYPNVSVCTSIAEFSEKYGSDI